MAVKLRLWALRWQQETHVGAQMAVSFFPLYSFWDSVIWQDFWGDTTHVYYLKLDPNYGFWQLTKLGTWITLYSLQSAQQIRECPFQVTLVLNFWQYRWLLLLPGSRSGLRIFFTIWLVYSGREEPIEAGQFRGLPEAILLLLFTFLLKELLYMMECFNLRGDQYNRLQLTDGAIHTQGVFSV